SARSNASDSDRSSMLPVGWPVGTLPRNGFAACAAASRGQARTTQLSERHRETRPPLEPLACTALFLLELDWGLRLTRPRRPSQEPIAWLRARRRELIDDFAQRRIARWRRG